MHKVVREASCTTVTVIACWPSESLIVQLRKLGGAVAVGVVVLHARASRNNSN